MLPRHTCCDCCCKLSVALFGVWVAISRWIGMDTGELDGVFRLFTTAELVIAAGALFNRLIIAALLFDLWPCAVPAFAQETKRERKRGRENWRGGQILINFNCLMRSAIWWNIILSKKILEGTNCSIRCLPAWFCIECVGDWIMLVINVLISFELPDAVVMVCVAGLADIWAWRQLKWNQL